MPFIRVLVNVGGVQCHWREGKEEGWAVIEACISGVTSLVNELSTQVIIANKSFQVKAATGVDVINEDGKTATNTTCCQGQYPG
jgi:hypothetical protein